MQRDMHSEGEKCKKFACILYNNSRYFIAYPLFKRPTFFITKNTERKWENSILVKTQQAFHVHSLLMLALSEMVVWLCSVQNFLCCID